MIDFWFTWVKDCLTCSGYHLTTSVPPHSTDTYNGQVESLHLRYYQYALPCFMHAPNISLPNDAFGEKSFISGLGIICCLSSVGIFLPLATGSSYLEVPGTLLSPQSLSCKSIPRAMMDGHVTCNVTGRAYNWAVGITRHFEDSIGDTC